MVRFATRCTKDASLRNFIKVILNRIFQSIERNLGDGKTV